MARHQRMPTLEAGYTYAVVPYVIKELACIRGGVHIRKYTPELVERRLSGIKETLRRNEI